MNVCDIHCNLFFLVEATGRGFMVSSLDSILLVAQMEKCGEYF